jgi:signal transduction histidine kinase
MFDAIQLLSLVVAAGIDTLLLIVLLEPRNRRFTPAPVLRVTFGVWLWHVGVGALLLFLMVSDAWARPFQSLSLMAACTGALLTPSAMAHCLVRLWRSGLALREASEPRYFIAYLPMAMIVFCVGVEVPTASKPLGPVAFGFVPYLFWSSAVNVAAAATFFRLSHRVAIAAARPFFALLAVLAALRTVVHVAIFLTVPDEPTARLIVYLSPVGSMAIFGYFVLRRNFLYLTLERGTLYAGIVAAAFLTHQFLFVTLTADWPIEARVIVVVLESVMVMGLVLAVPSWRRRCAEALRYLLGARVSVVRARLRQLATELAARTEAQPLETLDWFATRLKQALDVEFVAGTLFDAAGVVQAKYGETGRFTEQDGSLLLDQMRAASIDCCTHRDTPNRETARWLQTAGVSLAIVKSHRSLTGVLVLGRHARNRELSAEEIAAVLLLVEELVITIDNNLLQAERLDAERRAAQGEKLAALGLLAGSVAHEVKNPLSAIKTIATVLAEDLGPADPRAEDLRLILGEVDRLAAATTQLLDFARPRAGDGRTGCAVTALTSTLGVLRHLARQRDVVLEVSIASDLPTVRGDDQALREIFFNLLSNAFDAAGPGGRVEVVCGSVDGHLVTRVRDSGSGVAAEVRKRLFEPFLTTKETGTGLGLYVVGRRVRELGGTITCDNEPERGAIFTVRLPILATPENHA